MISRGRLSAAITWIGGVLASTVALGTPIPLPGFPHKIEGPVHEPVTLADVDQDGSVDLVVVGESKITVLSSDVHVVAGWPVDLTALTRHSTVNLAGPPAVGDVDGDGKPDIVLGLSYGIDADGAVVVLDQHGAVIWQVPVPAGLGAGCSLADLTGRHAYDVLAGTRGGQVLALDAHGRPVPGFPARIGAPATSPVAFGGLARGQKPVLAVGANDGKVYVISANGQAVPGFPLVTHFIVSGEPAFGDLDDDGQGDLVVASQDFGVYAVKADGTPIPGFPVQAQYRIYGGPALGDLDHDGKLDIVVASTDGKVFAWNNHGHLFPGFPVSAGSKIEREVSVVLADSSRTGKDSIFVTSSDDKLYGFDGAGNSLDGFPIDVGSPLTMPVIGDVVPDESEELIIGTVGKVLGYRLDRSGSLPQAPLSWAAAGHDSTREGHYGPNPPRYRSPELSPAAPRRGQPLKLAYEYYSLDGTPEPATRIRWKQNGQLVSDLDGLHEVPGARLKRGDRWQATIQAPGDYALYKEGPGATIFTSNEVTVADTPPSMPKIAVDQIMMGGTVRLKARLVTPATDVDGDPVTYTYRWEREGHVGSTEATIDANMAHKGEQWRVVVTPFDNDREGVAAVAEVQMVNTPPTAPEIAITPLQPTIEDDITVQITKPAVDADGDKLTYLYAFWVNGELRPLPPERPFLPKGVAHHGDVVKVEAWASDGETDSPHASMQTQVVNAAPKQAQVAIAPAIPHTHDELSAGLIVPARDPDRDPVQYRIQWTRDGQPFGTPGQIRIPASEVHKGQHWAVVFVPSDGKVEGPAARAEATVANEEPSRPRLRVSNANPLVTDASAVEIAQDSADPDGDSFKYELTWSVDGKPAFQEQASESSTHVVSIAEPPRPAPAPVVEVAVARGKKMKKKGRHTEIEAIPVAPVPVPQRQQGIMIAGKTTLRPGEFHKNQRILVQVTAVDSDGARSPAGTMEIVTKNTPPGAPRIALEPAQPTIDTGLRATVVTPAEDRDGDTLIYRYKWFRDGIEARDIGDRSALKPGEIKHGEQWRVVVAAFDGEAEGPSVDATATVDNRPPVAPEIALGPAHPTVVTGVSCDVKKAATDADSDPLTLEYRWFRNGQPFSIPSSANSVPGEAVRPGETWQCDVDAFDGHARSAVVTASGTVEVAAPSPASIAIGPQMPVAGTPLVCAITRESLDPDGDRVTYDFRWIPPAGVAAPALTDPARLPAGLVKKGQQWKCSVIARAGKSETAVATAEVLVGNTRPKPPALAIDPPEPSSGSNLRCKFLSAPSDVDGDNLSYAFTWYRNGVEQPYSPTSPEVPGRLVRAGDKWSCTVVVSDGLDQSKAAHSLDVSVLPRH